MNRKMRALLSIWLCLSIIGATPGWAAADPEYLFKMATIAPDGSIWAKRFAQFDEEVRKKTGGKVGFRLYTGGAMGDDRAMLRKMKIGQLHGAGFAMTGIGEVVPDFRVMSIPFLFSSYEEVDCAWKGLLPEMKKAFKEKGLYLLALSEVGFVYAMSASPVTTAEDLKKARVWAPEGDPLSLRFLQLAGIQPVALSIADVLTSLQTGMINTVFNGYYGSLVLQWFTRIGHVTDTPFSYAYGALVINQKDMDRLPGEYAKAIEAASETYFTGPLRQDTRKSNEESRETLFANNIQEASMTSETKALFASHRDTLVKEAKGDLFSAAIYDRLQSLLAEARSATSSSKP